MESEKPASIVAMLRIFVLPTTAKGGCDLGSIKDSESLSDHEIHFPQVEHLPIHLGSVEYSESPSDHEIHRHG